MASFSLRKYQVTVLGVAGRGGGGGGGGARGEEKTDILGSTIKLHSMSCFTLVVLAKPWVS